MTIPQFPPYPYGIARIYNKEKALYSWGVSIMRRGELVRKRFPDLKYGGAEQAYLEAIAFRDKILQERPPYLVQEFRAIVRKSNTTGIPGVHYTSPTKGTESWGARIRHPNGKNKTQTFSVKKYGYDHARELAINTRQAMLAEVSGLFLLREECKTVHAALPDIQDQTSDPALILPPKPQVLCQDYKRKTLSGRPGVIRVVVIKRDHAGAITSELAYWHASYRVGKIRKSQYFSIEKLGEENAFGMALRQREAWEAEFGATRPGKLRGREIEILLGVTVNNTSTEP